jgi:osmotically-inducible protein OsmY
MRRITLFALVVAPLFTMASAAFAQETSTAPAAAATVTSKKELRRANWHTEKQVRKALTSTKGLNASKIVVVARGTRITLDGTVQDESQIPLAQSAAAAAAPGSTIVNNLSVREPGH